MSVWYEPDRDRWRYKFRLSKRPFQGEAWVDLGEGNKRMARNKTEARAVEALAKRLAKKVIAGEKAEADSAPMKLGYTLAEALAAYRTQQKGSAGWANQRIYVRELRSWFGDGTVVTALSDKRLWEYIEWARGKVIEIFIGGPNGDYKNPDHWRPRKDGKKRSDATINRYLDCLRKACRIAHDARDEKGERLIPFIPNIPALAEPDKLPNPIPEAVLSEIFQQAPQHLAEAAALTVQMGFRKEEAFSLTKGQIDFDRRAVRLSHMTTKGQRDEVLPANDTAWALIVILFRQATERGVDHLITWPVRTDGGGIVRTMVDGVRHRDLPPGATFEWRAIKNPKRAWKTVMKRLGVKHKFHDLKGSFTTELAMHHASALVKEASRHRDYRTTERYIAVAANVRRKSVEALDGRRAFERLDLNRPLGVDLRERGTLESRSRKVAPKEPLALEGPSNPLGIMVGATGFEPATSSPPDFGSVDYTLNPFKKIANER